MSAPHHDEYDRVAMLYIYFQKRRKYFPIGSGKNVLFLTILKIHIEHTSLR